MISLQRKLVIVLAVLILITTLLYTEHSSVRALKEVGSLLAIIDSERVIVGMTDVRSVDHTRGDKESPVVLIEYSDFGCLMCAAMQDNFDRIVREEGVLLVSRHLYPHIGGSSFEQAVAAECVAKHAGDEAYFAFAHHLYDNQSVADDSTREGLSKKAVSLGADSFAYANCITNDTGVRERVLHDSQEGWRLGARGTPYIVVVYDGKPVGISYANEYSKFLKHVQKLVASARR